MNENKVDPRFITARILGGKPRHGVMYSAAAGKDGKIYLGLSSEMNQPGSFAQLIAYDPETDAFEDIVDLAKIIPEANETLRHPHSKLHTATCVGSDGKIYVTSHMTAPPAGEEFYHYWDVYNDPERCFKGSHLIIYDPATKRVEDFGIVSPKGGCRWMTYNPELEELYLTTFLTCHFMVIRLKTGEVKDMGRISNYDYMGPCYSACGAVFTTDTRGWLLRYDPKAETIEKLPLKVPNVPWRGGDGNGVFCFIPGIDKVKLYGVGVIGRRLFEYDPTQGRHGTVRDLGPAFGEDQMDDYAETPFLRTMAVGFDGRVYLGARYTVTGKTVEGDATGGMATRLNIVAVDPDSGEKEDYGVMQVEGLPPILTSVAATVGQDGTIYFTSWKVKEELPLQLILFNPNGVKQGPPLPRLTPEALAEIEKPKPQDLAKHAYYVPSRTENMIFVTRGTVIAKELGDAGRIPFIPRNECAISALVLGRGGRVFGATSGERSHFFMSTLVTKQLIRLNTFGDGPNACRGLVMDSRGRIFAGTMEENGDGRIYLYDAAEKELHLRRYDSADRGEFAHLLSAPAEVCCRVEDLGVVVPGEGVYTMTIGTLRDGIYGVTWPNGKFFTHHIESGETRVDDIFDEYIGRRGNLPRAMLCHDGDVYFSGKHGYIIRHCPEDGRFENTGAKIPVGAGREYLNTASALVEAGDGTIFGGTFADGYLFTFDPEARQILNLGKPSIENRIRDLTLGRDGMLWGLAGGDDQLTHLFRYSPATRGMEDFGMLRAKIPKTWMVHKADVLITGPDGEIYIGEHDALSHLLTYYPPIG